MTIQRPDLNNLPPEALAYIESLEAEITHLQAGKRRAPTPTANTPHPNPTEPPTTMNVITVSAAGLIKRSPRHLYSRQRRGGMGVFDLDAPKDDQPSLLAVADESDYLFCVTTHGRTFRLKVNRLVEAPVRSKGEALRDLLPLHADEQPALLLPERAEGYVIILTEKGHVRRFRHHYFGENLTAGLVLIDSKTLGKPTAGCWSAGDADLLIATRSGKAIRFAERQVPARGCLGIRLAQGDTAVAVAPVNDDSGLFLLGGNGKGTIRLMSRYSANKSPGSGGKAALKTDNLIGAFPITGNDDIFIVSKLGKLIRFQALEVPPKEGAVQGVNCMSLRSDVCTAVTR